MKQALDEAPLAHDLLDTLQQLGLAELSPAASTGRPWLTTAGNRAVRDITSPADGQRLGAVQVATVDDYNAVVDTAHAAFLEWRLVPAPRRGEIVRQIGNRLRELKEPLGKLVSLEMGKIYQEGLGEVQEMIDICDFAVGLSRQLHGYTMHSERPAHRMYEQYHPLGVVGIISAFNFRWPCGPGMQCSPPCVGIRACGNPPKKRP